MKSRSKLEEVLQVYQLVYCHPHSLGPNELKLYRGKKVRPRQDMDTNLAEVEWILLGSPRQGRTLS